MYRIMQVNKTTKLCKDQGQGYLGNSQDEKINILNRKISMMVEESQIITNLLFYKISCDNFEVVLINKLLRNFVLNQNYMRGEFRFLKYKDKHFEKSYFNSLIIYFFRPILYFVKNKLDKKSIFIEIVPFELKFLDSTRQIQNLIFLILKFDTQNDGSKIFSKKLSSYFISRELSIFLRIIFLTN